jgi:uncharacterized protein YbjT (DUF2867 family)
MSNKILVLGATGKTGRRVVERLAKLNLPVIIGSRNAEPAFDWENDANWTDVLKDVSKVYITFQPDLAVPTAEVAISKFVTIAKASGVKQLVLLSGRGEKEAQVCENIVINSSLDWTIIRASWFMQNFSENFLLDSILSNEVILPIIRALEPFVDADDIADVVVAALTDSKHSHKIYELTGPELLSFQSATAKIATASKRQISYNEINMNEYLAMLKSYKLPDDFIWLIQYLFTEVLDGRNESLTNDIENILGRKPTSFNEYATKTAKTGVWKIQ